MRIPDHIASLELHGGHPALDFVNTLSSWEHPAPRDYLETGSDVAAWMQRRGLLGPATAEHFAALPQREARALLRSARKTRTQLHGLFAAIAAGRLPGAARLEWLNSELAELARFRKLGRSGRALDWVVTPSSRTPHSLLAPVLFAAAELLTDGRLERLKACPPPDGCGWLFYDSSRNGRRTWCSMQACGNLAKARRFRARQQR